MATGRKTCFFHNFMRKGHQVIPDTPVMENLVFDINDQQLG